MSNQRILSWLLSLTGVIEILAFVAVVMPQSWMVSAHAWLGMGQMPEGALVMFMIRQASYAYGMHGVSLLVLATDLKRFRPLILLNGVSFLLAGPVFFLIDYTTGMPWFWTITDSLFCGLFGVAVLVLDRRVR